MKRRLWLFLTLLPVAVYAELEQPPYKTGDPGVDSNFSQIYYGLAQHTHSGTDGTSQLSSPFVTVTASPFNAKGDGVTDDAAAFQAAHDSLPTSGGIIYVPITASRYRIGSAIVFSKPVILMGQIREFCEIYASTTGFNMFTSSRSLSVYNLTLTRDPVVAATSAKAINFDVGQFDDQDFIFERLKITGWDIGIAGSGYNGTIRGRLARVKDSYITVNSSHTGGVAPTINITNVAKLEIIDNDLTQPSTSNENNIYAIGVQNLRVEGNDITKGIGVKLVTNSISTTSVASVQDNIFRSCSLGISFQTDTNPILSSDIEGNTFLDGRVNDAQSGEILFSNTGSVTTGDDFPAIYISKNTFLNTDKICVRFELSANRIIGNVKSLANVFINWSKGASGTHWAYTAGSTGNYRRFISIGDTGDGSSNGRALFNLGSFTRRDFIRAVEVSTTGVSTDGYLDTIVRSTGSYTVERSTDGAIWNCGPRTDGTPICNTGSPP